MPRPKPWLARTAHILKAIQDADTPAFRRTDIETLFGIGRSAALELMKVVGTAHSAGVPRANLIHYLTYGPEAHLAEVEARRRAALARKLTDAERHLKLRNRLIDVAPGAEWATFTDLPQVAIDPGRITILCSGAEDALRTLWGQSCNISTLWPLVEQVCGAGVLEDVEVAQVFRNARLFGVELHQDVEHLAADGCTAAAGEDGSPGVSAFLELGAEGRCCVCEQFK